MRRTAMRSFAAAIVLATAMLTTLRVASAQDAPPAEPEEDAATAPEDDEPLPEPPAEEPPPPRIPVLDTPTQRPPPPPEPTIEELEEQLVPTLVLPEWRVRASGGISLNTSGSAGINARLTQEAEFQPASLQFILFGLGVAETLGELTLVQAGLRVGGFATFCEDRVVRCAGAITLQLGVVAGTLGTNFDFSADVDLRFLFSELVELFVRGGFVAITLNTFVNITGGIGFAF